MTVSARCCFFLTIVFGLGCVAGCGSPPATSGGDNEPGKATQASAKPRATEISLTRSDKSAESLLADGLDDPSPQASSGFGTQGMFDTGEADEHNFSLHRVNLDGSSADSMPLIGDTDGLDNRELTPGWDH